MFICTRFVHSVWVCLVIFLVSVVLCVSCTKFDTSSINQKDFYRFKLASFDLQLGDTEKFDFEPIAFTSSDDGRFLVQYRKKEKTGSDIGIFFRISMDGGKSFSVERRISNLMKEAQVRSESVTFYFLRESLAAYFTKNDDLYFLTSTDNSLEHWTKPVRINDERSSSPRGVNIKQNEAGNIFCLWDDSRTGINLVYVSSSEDKGRAWTPNKAVEPDFRNMKQEFPSLIVGANGRLLAFWDDWRDEKTLVDVRYSYSDDQGMSWEKSEKINDDDKPVWQGRAATINEEGNILVAFADFREEGGENDNNWNIYYARSIDNGTTWQKNKRLNDVTKGRQEGPVLAKDASGKFYCIWSTTQETLFRQIAFSYSKDDGETWSPSDTLTSKDRMVGMFGYSLNAYSSDSLALFWNRESYGSTQRVSTVLTKSSEYLTPEKPQPREIEKKTPMKYRKGEILFEDDFSSGNAEKWDGIGGVWSVVNEEYKGIRPEEGSSFVSFSKYVAPDRYVLEGKFKLDETHHSNADIYFGVNETGLKNYAVRNRFRNGSWLSEKDSDLPNGLHISGGISLAQKPFSFRSGRWYKFVLVVSPEQVDYYVNGVFMISYANKELSTKGRIGFGGWVNAPTYFDDILVYELKE